MAAEKRNQATGQSIVDQDAAITAYLDGLLRDPEFDEVAESPRPRKAPGLKVIAPETGESTGIEPDADMASADDMSTATGSEAGEHVTAALPEETGEVAPEDSASDEPVSEPRDPQDDTVEGAEAALEESVGTAPGEATGSDDAAVEVAPPAAEPEVTKDAPAATEEAAADTPEDPDAKPAAAMATEPETDREVSPWAWLRVGGMTLAIPAETVVSRHVDAELEPVPGAPAQVAGALSVEGRPRLILSLASVTGARPSGTATEVLLLGTGGLWGVVGETVEQPPAFDAEAVQWRSESQKAERRGWLAGTHPAAGVAVLDVAGLRTALKGSR